MKLTYDEVLKISFGYTAVKKKKGNILLYRMNKRQRKCFKRAENSRKYEFISKTKGTSGISFDFYTDSLYFEFEYENAVTASSREWYYFDLLINGETVSTFGEEKAEIKSGKINYSLDGKLNRVTLYFPNLFRADIKSVSLSDGAKIEPVKKDGRLLCYGDSITQGYDSRKPSLTYVNIMGHELNFETVNLGVGSAFFDDKCIDKKANYNETAVTVALGINDYANHSIERTKSDCLKYLTKLTAVHEGKRVFLILPINFFETKDTLSLKNLPALRETLKETAEKFESVKVIDTSEFLEPRAEYFSPDGVHPNESGAKKYAEKLLEILKPELVR